MAQPSVKSPLGNRPATTSPSPAQDALLSTLEAAGEPHLSLRKKKSWFGSIRDVVHKSARAAFDTFKADPHKNETQIGPAEAGAPAFANDGHADESPPRPSIDSMTESLLSSATPVQAHSERRPRLMSKAATSSLRQHLSGHPSRKQRASVSTFAGRPSNDLSHHPGLDQAPPLPPEDFDELGHRRKSSVANSIVGSLRGMSRKVGKSKPMPVITKHPSPEMSPEALPLPSSPIDIPVAAPSLDLDLGTGGFMTPMFDRSPERNPPPPSLDTKKLMDPANITSGMPPPTPVLGSDKPPTELAGHSFMRPSTPCDLLKIRLTDLRPPTIPPGPQTPMPGTSFALEVDGTNSEKSDKSHVFERSVTPAFEREGKEIRKMRSLDAMAEACAVAHANDELSQIAEVESTSDREPGIQTSSGYSLHALTPARRAGSSETAEALRSCKEEMPELSRQCTPANERKLSPMIAPPGSEKAGNSIREDPFDDSNVVRSGPPSPTRSVELPFRPRVQHQVAIDEAPTPRPCTDDAAAELEHPAENDGAQTENWSLVNPLQSQVRQDSVVGDHAKENTDPFQDQHEEENKNQPHELKLPAHEEIHIRKLDTVPPTVRPIVIPPHGLTIPPSPCRLAKTQEDSSPRSMRWRSTYTAGLGDTEYKFSFDNWLKETSNAGAPESQPTTPNRRRMDMSLDSVSTTESRKTPQFSPTTTANFGTTPTAGGKTDAGLKQSDNTTRQNAINHAAASIFPSTYATSRRGPPRFLLGASDETDSTGFQLANFENAYGSGYGSYEMTPQGKYKPLQARVDSEDSVADSLKNAALNYSQLEEQLADAPKSDEADIFSDLHESIEADDLPSLDNPLNHFEFKPTVPPTIDQVFGPQPATPPRPTTPQPCNELPSSSLPESAGTITGRSNAVRLASGDTLDHSLKLFMSSESGYQADDSSMVQDLENSSATKARPARYCSKGKGGRRVLGEVSSNNR